MPFTSSGDRLDLRAGEIRTLRVREAHDYDLTGELVDSPISINVRSPELVQLVLS